MYTENVIGIFWYLLAASSISQGLICYECNNAKTDEECTLKGQIRLCEDTQSSCQTTERIDFAYGPIVKITKRCKQARACEANFKQNNNKRMPQCRYFKNLSVCRCCCTKDLCNYNTDTCTGVTIKKLLRENGPTCPKLRRLRNGVMACDNKNNPGSMCNFRCKLFHDLRGPGMISCQVNKKKASWSDGMPCCTKPCPPHGNMDLVFGVDSSFETEDDWLKVKELVKWLVRSFIVGRRDSRIGIITYNEKVAEANEIFLSSYNSSNQLAEAVNRLQRHPGKTKGTRIGQLLDHVNRVSFTKEHGDRKNVRDILIVLNAGSPLKEKTDPETTGKLMRDNGIEVITVGVGSYVDMKQLRGTAGFKKRVIEIPGGIETIGESKFQDRIIKLICGRTCTRA